jgi:tripartite-type tricarboxylate transporter receptor subunit TctC
MGGRVNASDRASDCNPARHHSDGEHTGVANEPEIKAKLSQLGFEPTSIPGEQFQRDVAAELQRWDEVVGKAGLKQK